MSRSPANTAYQAIADLNELVITISQSGETLDTMEALKYAHAQGQTHSLSICNVMESACRAKAKLVLYTRAGAEIGVASTKAFTTQLVALFGLAVTLGKLRGHVSAENEQQYMDELRQFAGQYSTCIELGTADCHMGASLCAKPTHCFWGAVFTTQSRWKAH